MCRTCGCDADHDHDHEHQHAHGHEHHAHVHPHPHAPRRISVETELLAKNDRLAHEVRARLAWDGIAAYNLIGSPGAGKTTLLERTIRALDDVPIAVIEGDQATDHDARRIAATGVRVVQVNTGAGCHLDAAMIDRGLGELELGPRSLLLVENVGNLVCPALFDLGERAKIVVMSVTEGEDKPLKYPHVFRAATAMVLTKMDLVPHLDIDPERIAEYAYQINPSLRVFSVSATREASMAEWCGWLREQIGQPS